MFVFMCFGYGLFFIVFVGGKGLMVQNSGEFFYKVVVIQFKFVYVLVQVVICYDCWDCGEQINCGGDQCFGDIWCYYLQGGLFYCVKGDKGVYNFLDGIEQIDIWVD